MSAGIVFKSKVKVPHRTCSETRGVSVLVHVNAPIGVGVAAEFAHKEMLKKRFGIKKIAIAVFGIEIQVAGKARSHFAEIVLYIVELLRHNVILIGRFNGNRQAVCRRRSGEMRFFLVGVSVNFQKVSAAKVWFRNIYGSHFCNTHTVFPYFYLVAKLIGSFVFAINYNVHKSACRSIIHAYCFANLECQRVSHQSFVAVVVYQRPLFCFCRHVEQSRFVGEFEFVGLFGEIPRSIAPSPHFKTVGVKIFSRFGNHTYYSGKIRFL